MSIQSEAVLESELFNQLGALGYENVFIGYKTVQKNTTSADICVKGKYERNTSL